MNKGRVNRFSRNPRFILYISFCSKDCWREEEKSYHLFHINRINSLVYFKRTLHEITRVCLIFFYAVVFNSLLARTLRAHFRELYFSSSITRVSIPWAGGVHSKMPTTVSSSSCSNVCNDGPSTSSSRPAAKSRSRLFGERKREGGNAGAGIPGMDERPPSCWNFSTNFSRFDSYRRITRARGSWVNDNSQL